jgi:hypothetical protein
MISAVVTFTAFAGRQWPVGSPTPWLVAAAHRRALPAQGAIRACIAFKLEPIPQEGGPLPGGGGKAPPELVDEITASHQM